MLASGTEILQYIPQRSPIVMVDSLIECGDGITISGLLVSEDNIFVVNGELREPGIIEHIAQSAAMGVGYRFVSQGKPVPIGFIGALKDLEILEFPRTGDLLRTEIRVEYDVLDASIISARVSCNSKVLASTVMKIFMKREG